MAEGYQYVYSQALSGLELHGNLLKANCKGRGNKVYRVQAKLGDGEIIEAGCSCPDGLSGRCRHVAALVLTWLNRGENFQRGQSIKEIIETLSRAELEDILVAIVQRKPDVKILVERQAPQTTDKAKSIESKDYRSIVEALLITESANSSLWETIDAIKLLGEDMLRQREWATAVDIFVNLYSAIRLRHVRKESPVADEVCQGCIEDLMRVGGAPLDSARQSMLSEVLFEELSENIKIEGSVNKDVLRWMAEMPSTQIRKWAALSWDALHQCQQKAARRLWGMVCLIFYGTQLETQTQRKLYQEIGWFAELTQQLAQEQNFDEIPAYLSCADDYEVLTAVERLIKMGFPKQAFAVVEKRVKEKPSDILSDWLKGHMVQLQSDKEAIELAEKMFSIRPDIQSYHRLRTECLRAGTWDQTQDQCLLNLKQREKYELLMDIFLDDWDLERAVFLWQEIPEKISRPQSIQLAQMAEAVQPITAIKIYQDLLETQLQSLIDAKIANASAAGEAVQKEIEMLVTRLKSLITKVYGSEAWVEYLTSLRNRDYRI